MTNGPLPRDGKRPVSRRSSPTGEILPDGAHDALIEEDREVGIALVSVSGTRNVEVETEANELALDASLSSQLPSPGRVEFAFLVEPEGSSKFKRAHDDGAGDLVVHAVVLALLVDDPPADDVAGTVKRLRAADGEPGDAVVLDTELSFLALVDVVDLHALVAPPGWWVSRAARCR